MLEVRLVKAIHKIASAESALLCEGSNPPLCWPSLDLFLKVWLIEVSEVKR